MDKTRVPGLDPRTASGWLLKAFDTAMRRDPVDAANDAEYLAALLGQRAADLAETHFAPAGNRKISTKDRLADLIEEDHAAALVELSEGERAVLAHIAGLTR